MIKIFWGMLYFFNYHKKVRQNTNTALSPKCIFNHEDTVTDPQTLIVGKLRLSAFCRYKNIGGP